jgi:hypothetical protein
MCKMNCVPNSTIYNPWQSSESECDNACEAQSPKTDCQAIHVHDKTIGLLK